MAMDLKEIDKRKNLNLKTLEGKKKILAPYETKANDPRCQNRKLEGVTDAINSARTKGDTGAKSDTGTNGDMRAKSDTGTKGDTRAKSDKGAKSDTRTKSDKRASSDTGTKDDTRAKSDTRPRGDVSANIISLTRMTRGYTAIDKEIALDLINSTCKITTLKIVLGVYRFTSGFGMQSSAIPGPKLAKYCGIHCKRIYKYIDSVPEQMLEIEKSLGIVKTPSKFYLKHNLKTVIKLDNLITLYLARSNSTTLIRTALYIIVFERECKNISFYAISKRITAKRRHVRDAIITLKTDRIISVIKLGPTKESHVKITLQKNRVKSLLRMFPKNKDEIKLGLRGRAKGDSDTRAKGDSDTRAKGDSDTRAKGDTSLNSSLNSFSRLSLKRPEAFDEIMKKKNLLRNAADKEREIFMSFLKTGKKEEEIIALINNLLVSGTINGECCDRPFSYLASGIYEKIKNRLKTGRISTAPQYDNIAYLIRNYGGDNWRSISNEDRQKFSTEISWIEKNGGPRIIGRKSEYDLQKSLN